MPTRDKVVPGNWASVQRGQWHLLSTDAVPQNFRDNVTSRCGITFAPFNVTGGEAPPTNDNYICGNCSRKAGR